MRSIRIGSIFGIELRIDFSWFVIFFLILWTFTAGVFPARYPGLSPATYIAMGAVGTGLFFASIIAHELAHSLVARTRGISVESITLFIFGGMARTRTEFENPQDELLIAGVGPLSSLAIAGGFAAIATGGTALGWNVGITGTAAYLGYINLLLALFNLFPGFPLDGGRILRALVWRRTGDLTRATRVAAGGGKLLGWILIGLGLLQFAAANPIGGLWMIFIGWFVRAAAEAGYVQHLIRNTLETVPAGTVMRPPLETAPADLTLDQFLDAYLYRVATNDFVVEQAGRTVGFLTLDQVRKVPREAWNRTTVAEIMSPLESQVTVPPEEPMSRVLEQLQTPGAARVLVASDGQLLGVITGDEITRLMSRIQMTQAR
ncbi:MAG TPA: site-2 protease family protein [Longimicrobiaceae bacterium]|nr:site-2 protease family protein [Longimicrobiaceae bacterium]